MKLGTFIPGGRDHLGQLLRRFVIGDRHTAYEWAMIYSDRHPQPRETHGANVEDMRVREVFLGARSTASMNGRGPQSRLARRKIARDFYREIVEDIAAGRIIPLKRVYCADDPDRLDTTQCIIARADVLAIARRRLDGGQYIKTLMAKHSALAESTDPDQPAQPAPETKLRRWVASADINRWWQAFRQECDANRLRPSAKTCEEAARAHFNGPVNRNRIRELYAALPDGKKATMGAPKKSTGKVGENKSAADLPK
jgi:hypothetical protein